MKIKIDKSVLFLFIGLAFCMACGEDLPPPEIDHGLRDYVFLGHIYEDPTSIDPRLEKIDYLMYDQIWLGGDICSETTSDINTLTYLDSLFNLESLNTHWAWGNHDVRNGNLEYITDRTGRKSFYTTHSDNLTILVLNTTFGHSGVYDTTQVKEQLELIQSVCDTIEKSTHLILLSHHVVWMEVDLINNTYGVANGGGPGVLFEVSPNLTYDDVVYPKLVEVQNRGVQVIHIAGDLGQKVATYEHQTVDGIHLLGSGITSNTDYHSQFPSHGIPDSILILHHDLNAETIDWEFEELKF